MPSNSLSKISNGRSFFFWRLLLSKLLAETTIFYLRSTSGRLYLYTAPCIKRNVVWLVGIFCTGWWQWKSVQEVQLEGQSVCLKSVLEAKTQQWSVSCRWHNIILVCLLHPTCPADRGISVCSKPQEMRIPSLSGAPPHWGWTNPWHLQVKTENIWIISKWERELVLFLNYFNSPDVILSTSVWCHMISNLPPSCVPGLKRMMARRQPSSVLSICMSLILLTSSVKTLRRDERRGE